MINKIVMYPFTALNSEKDVNHNESYLIQKNVNESLEKEIQELKEALELNKTLTEYTPINATILSRNKSYWYNIKQAESESSLPLGFCYCDIKTRNPNTSPITVIEFGFIALGRGRRTRTLGTWFWRPLLYQLSYTPIYSI